MGLAAGIMFPALTVLVAAWVPARERSKLGSIALGGSQVHYKLIEMAMINSLYKFIISLLKPR